MDIENLIRQYSKPLFGFVYRMVGNRDLAEDILQNAFVKVWKNINNIDRDKNLRTWLFTIARNTTIDELRKVREINFEEGFEEIIPDNAPPQNELFDQNINKKTLEEALEKLEPKYKEVLLLHYMEEMTFEEVAEVLNRPMNTVKSQSRRGLERLHQIIDIKRIN